MGTQNRLVTEKVLGILKSHGGDVPAVMYIADTKKKFYVPKEAFCDASEELITELSSILGAENVKIS